MVNGFIFQKIVLSQMFETENSHAIKMLGAVVGPSPGPHTNAYFICMVKH